MRRFCGDRTGRGRHSDETTILRFRHLLERHQLNRADVCRDSHFVGAEATAAEVRTIVDATIIEAPPSTKNEQKARDPEMHQGKKGGGWHFGMKAHIGTDVHGRVHSLATTHAGVADITQMSKLLHGKERLCTGTRRIGVRSIERPPRRADLLPRQPPTPQ